MKIANQLTELIGTTPLLSLERYSRDAGLDMPLVAKLEMRTPGGSAKDRAALSMIASALSEGKLQPGGTIIEPTSGNMGVALAWIASAMGLKTIIVMPDTMSRERRDLIRAYGAELRLSPGGEGMAGAVALAERICRETPGAVILGQFDNPDNPAAHARTTAREIWNDTDGTVDVLVAGVGTGGTISGTGRTLKQFDASIHVVAVEPATSPLLSKGHSGPHQLQGIGANFIPKNYDASCVDEVVTVTDDDALRAARRLAATEGLLAGISSGAALDAATRLARRDAFRGKRIVAILPDTGERYLSTHEFDFDNYPL